MKRILLVVLLASCACAAHPLVVTPQGQAAVTADAVVVRVNELGNAAIAAQASGALSVATTRTLIGWCLSADQVLGAVPSGWQATLQASWAQAKSKIPAADLNNPAVVSAVAAIDVIIGAVRLDVRERG